MIIHAFVTTKLDLNNSLPAGLPACARNKLQLVQNAAAKIVKGLKKYDHVSPALRDLHWLPVKRRIEFKVLLLCYKALNDGGPAYLKDMLHISEPQKSGLRSASDFLRLDRPKTELVTYGDRAFSFAAIELWNNLPLKLRAKETLSAFKSSLKTHLFE